MKKRTKKDIFIKLIKYILLFLLIFEMIAVFLFKKSIYALMLINLLIYIYMIFYILYFKKELLESSISYVNKLIFGICIIIMVLNLIYNFNIFGLINIFTIVSVYCLGADILRVLIRKIGIITLYEYMIEFVLLTRNNIYTEKMNITNKRNILILVSKLSNGGAERVAANLANNLATRYDNVIVVTYNSKGKNTYECSAKRIDIKDEKIKRIIQIREIKKKYNITHCISFCTTANFLNCASNFGEKKIISIRNYLSLNSKERFLNKIQARISAKFADKIVTVSKVIEIEQEEKYKVDKKKLITINNFYEEDLINEKIKNGIITDKEKKLFDEYDVVITIGRLVHQKGQWYLIRAFKEVIKECPNARLVILGKGEYKNFLQELISKLDMKKYVKLYGFKENPYIYLKNSKVFVLESLFEGMSNVILEAMSCGLPIIATDCLAGNREILAPDTEITKNTNKMELAKYGIIVPVGNGKLLEDEELTHEEVELKKAIIKMLTDKKLQQKYKKASLTRINDFKKEKIIDQWYKLIEEDNI